jgi:hypothetical protein
MTGVATTQNGTVRAFLLGGDASLAELMARRGGSGTVGHALRGVSAHGRAAVESQLAAVASGLLDLDLGDIVVSAWRKHAALAAAARDTAADPKIEQVVAMATHRVTSTHRPYVDVRVGGALVARVQFELSLAFVITAVAAVVRQGRLMAVRSGRCDLTGTLSMEGVELVSREAQLDLQIVVRLGDGLAL